jgi:hypothetical protein
MNFYNPYFYELFRQDMRHRGQEAAEHRLGAALRPRRRIRLLHLLGRLVPEPSSVNQKVPPRITAV